MYLQDVLMIFLTSYAPFLKLFCVMNVYPAIHYVALSSNGGACGM